jgi:DNA polymerase III subunit epsilon
MGGTQQRGWAVYRVKAVMTLDFTAIDFETANSHRGSPCSVGLVKVRGGLVVDEISTLIHPPAGFGHFDGFNICLHGIDAKMVAGAPGWPEAADQIMSYAGSDILVCHNAGFDIGVIRAACDACEIPWPCADFLCTLVLARRAYRLLSYRLPFVAAQCGVSLSQHHKASDDAHCAALITIAMARKQGAETLAELAGSFGVCIGHLEAGCYAPSMWQNPDGHARRLILPDVNPEADSDHPLYGRYVVFTGALQSRTRQMAWEDVANVGGIPERTVTKRTNILVTGDINTAVLAPGMITTGKAAKAEALLQAGQEIELMTEDDFLRSL